MRVPGKFEAGLTSGVLTEGKFIKGAYIVIPTLKARDELPHGVLVPGTLVFVNENKSEYRYESNKTWTWVPPSFADVPNDGYLYGRVNGTWERILIDQASIETALADLYEKLGVVNSRLDQIDETLTTKQDTLVSGENIKTFHGQSLLGEGDIETPTATTESIGGIVSGTTEVENGDVYEVVVNAKTSVANVTIPPITVTATAEQLIEVLEDKNFLLIDCGDASI